MSLVAWYPLTKDTFNQGIDEIDLTTRGTVPFDATQFGHSAHFTGNCANSFYRSEFTCCNDDFTWMCWVSTSSIGAYQFILSQGRDYEQYGMNIVINPDGSLNVLYGTTARLCCQVLTVNKWYHVAVTVSSTSGVKVYINGILIKTASFVAPNYSQDEKVFSIGKMAHGYAGTTKNFPLNGYVADVRIYDNVLSEKEVKELSKGLILHYPLNQIDKSPNLWKRTRDYNTSAVQWVDNNNNPTNTTPTIDHEWNGFSVIRISGSWTDVSQRATVKANTDYMLSAWIRAASDSAKPDMHFYDNSSNYIRTSVDSTSGSNYIGVCDTQWKRVWATFNTGDSTVSTCRFESSNSNTYYVCGVKLSEGVDSSPEWCPHPDDPEWYGYGEYDISGFSNNIENTADVVPRWSSDSPRYDGSYLFNKTVAMPVCSFATANQTFTELSVSIWFKTSSSSGLPTMFSFGQNSFIRARLSADKNLWSYMTVGTTSVETIGTAAYSLADNKWHHAVIVFNNGRISNYADGVLLVTKDATSTATYLTCNSANCYIGGYQGTNSEPWNGNLSDLRVYGTALSSAEVLELYNNPISIARSGALLTNGEVIEE